LSASVSPERLRDRLTCPVGEVRNSRDGGTVHPGAHEPDARRRARKRNHHVRQTKARMDGEDEDPGAEFAAI